jgi:transcriptional regulator with XRE-family HTH domain
VLIGQELKQIREAKNLSQGHIEQRTGLTRCYTSRVENGHTVPSVETLEKYARALEVPLYQLFYDGKGPVKKPNIPSSYSRAVPWGNGGKEHHELRLFIDALSRMDERDRSLLLAVGQRLLRRKTRSELRRQTPETTNSLSVSSESVPFPGLPSGGGEPGS